MFNSSILDAAVGVGFVFLLLSTICTAAREGIEHWLKTRASYLEYGIRELLKDPDGTGLAKHFFEHPLIQGYYQGEYVPLAKKKPNLLRLGKHMPSYIPATSFAMALLDLAARGPRMTADSASPDHVEATFASVRAGVRNLQNPYVQRAVLAALDAAQGDLERARENLERWYDGAMDRVSGWYKRSSQSIIFVLACLVTCALNVNTLTIADHLYRDKALRETVVAAAQHTDQALTYASAQSNLAELQLPIGWSGGWGAPLNQEERSALRDQRVDQWLRSHPDAAKPVRDAAVKKIEAQLAPNYWNQLIAPIVGLLITAFAATLGAPFWFDVLNRVMVIRASVKPHEKSQEEGSEDRQPQIRFATVPALTVAPGLAAERPANDQHDHDVDPCGEPITDATDDADLPPARGGVEG